MFIQFLRKGRSSSNTTTNRNTATPYYLRTVAGTYSSTWYVRVLPEGDDTSKHALKASQVLPGASHVFCTSILCSLLSLFLVVPSSFITRKANRRPLFLIFAGTGDTQPCGGPPRTIFSVDIGVTDVT